MSKLITFCLLPKKVLRVARYQVVSQERGDYVTIHFIEQNLYFKKHVCEILADEQLLEEFSRSDVYLMAYIAGMGRYRCEWESGEKE